MFSKCCSEPWDYRGGSSPRKGKLAPDDTHDQAGSCGSPDFWCSSHLKHFSQSKEDETENTGERPTRPTHRPGARKATQCRGRSQQGCLAAWPGDEMGRLSLTGLRPWHWPEHWWGHVPHVLPCCSLKLWALCAPTPNPSLLRPSSLLLRGWNQGLKEEQFA